MEYRRLEKGEIDDCADGWRDDPVWIPVTSCVGEPAPDPAYPSHRQYRRQTESEVKE